MSKSEVYSWRLSPELKQELERWAREEGTTIAGLLERIVEERLAEVRGDLDDDEEQRRLRAAVAPCIGSLHGGDPGRSREVATRLRKKLRARRR